MTQSLSTRLATIKSIFMNFYFIINYVMDSTVEDMREEGATVLVNKFQIHFMVEFKHLTDLRPGAGGKGMTHICDSVVAHFSELFPNGKFSAVLFANLFEMNQCCRAHLREDRRYLLLYKI